MSTGRTIRTGGGGGATGGGATGGGSTGGGSIGGGASTSTSLDESTLL